MEWSNEKTIMFIEDYRNNEILWNHQLSDFKNNRKKLDIFKTLSEKYRSDIGNLKKKIKKLRTQFHREHKALTKTTSGQSAQKKSKWCYYDCLSFLLDVDDLPREGTSTDINTRNENESAENSSDEQNSAVEYRGDEATNSENTPVSQDLSSTPRQKVFKKPICSRSTDEGKRRADEAYDILKASTRRDEFSIYGEHVGNEIRKLQPTAQIYVKHAINHILFEAALGHYNLPKDQFQRNFPSCRDDSSTSSPGYKPATESHMSSEATTAQELSEFLTLH